MTTRPSQGGGSSSSEPSYSPVMDVSKGGSVKVNPRTPGEGDEVTITVDPDRGYEVGDVTVTDRSGRDVRVTAERDGTYTFEQPKGRVTIAVTFVREGTSTFFADVAETYRAYDEIAWAYENGYVNGVTATTFAPGASISRQQIWMILARIAGDDPADMAAARPVVHRQRHLRRHEPRQRRHPPAAGGPAVPLRPGQRLRQRRPGGPHRLPGRGERGVLRGGGPAVGHRQRHPQRHHRRHPESHRHRHPRAVRGECSYRFWTGV